MPYCIHDNITIRALTDLLWRIFAQQWMDHHSSSLYWRSKPYFRHYDHIGWIEFWNYYRFIYFLQLFYGSALFFSINDIHKCWFYLEPYDHVARRVTRINVHPKYQSKLEFVWNAFDIALVKMDRPVAFTPNIVPICLPDINDKFEGDEVNKAIS